MASNSNNVSKPKKNKSKKNVSMFKRFVFTVLKILTVFFIIFTLSASAIVGGIIYGYIKSASLITDDQLQLKKFSSTIYDSNGHEIANLKGEENRVWADDKNIPKYLKDAFVSIEDQRFYTHSGVDIRRITSAVLSLGQEHGGSTITQQLVRNLTNDKERTFQRKVQEQWRAIQLEKRLEKWQILELYLNVIYLGEDCYGVESAAKRYFNKDVNQLDLAECASLAGITNLPARYTPDTEKGKKNNVERQQIILSQMRKQGYITEEEYEKAKNEKLNFVEGPRATQHAPSKQSYFVDQVVLDVKKDLMAKGMSEQLALKTIYNNGLKIYTTMDSNVQKAMDEVFMDPKFFPGKGPNGEKPQAAMVVIDPKNGEVKAMYGGNGEKQGNTLNRATQMHRSAGSSFKPIADYAPALDQRQITASSVIDDVPVYMLGADKKRYPEDYPRTVNGQYGRFYEGLTTIREAITKSINVVAAKVWMDLGPDMSFKYLQKSGIDTKGENKNLSISLGGLTNGVSPLQMAAAYVPFSHKGIYYKPITYLRVEDSEGNVILDKKNDDDVKQTNNIVYQEETAYIMTSMMRDVMTVGTAYPDGIIKNSRQQVIPTAGKTGTTNDDKDRWFLGYSPYYVGAVWFGYDKPAPVQGVSYNPSLKIWSAVMTKIHSSLESVDFQMPSGIVRKSVCIYSGKTPSSLCSQDPRGDSIRDEYFIKGTEPKDDDLCDVHVSTKVCKESKDSWGRNLLATQYCPATTTFDRVFVSRKTPFVPVKSDDPYPLDWQYELPKENCNVHGSAVPQIQPTQSPPSVQTQQGQSTSPEPLESTKPLKPVVSIAPVNTKNP